MKKSNDYFTKKIKCGTLYRVIPITDTLCGTNELKVESKNPWWKMLLGQFTDILVIILIIAAMISGYHGEIVDTLVIVFIIILNGLIGFFQEFRTEKTLAALQKMILPEIRVIRDGQEQKISVKEIVP